jgi:hypothetical protein
MPLRTQKKKNKKKLQRLPNKSKKKWSCGPRNETVAITRRNFAIAIVASQGPQESIVAFLGGTRKCPFHCQTSKRASKAVPNETLEQPFDDKSATSSSSSALKTLQHEGIDMTDKGLTDAFFLHGLTKFTEQPEDVFNPEQHEALFECPDPDKDNWGPLDKL